MLKPRTLVVGAIMLVAVLLITIGVPFYQHLVQAAATEHATQHATNGYDDLASPSPTPTPTVTTAAPDYTAVPSGNLPGWKLQYVNTFTKDAAIGDFEDVYGNTFMGYSGFFDHSNNGTGLYAPLRVLSAKNGYLDYYLHTENGNPLIAAPTPTGYVGQKYGRYTLRFKADLAPGYRIAFLLWPDGKESPDLWKNGEIDFPEVNLIPETDPSTDLTPSINGFSHDTTGNPRFNPLRFITNERAQQWHTATIEWTPTRVTFTLDGMSKTSTDPAAIPKVKMHWVLQTQTSSTKRVKPAADVQGHVYIDWIAQYAYDPATDTN